MNELGRRIWLCFCKNLLQILVILEGLQNYTCLSQHRIQNWTTLKFIGRSRQVTLLLTVKIRNPALLRITHRVLIVGVRVVIFLLFRPNFMSILASILDLKFVWVVYLEELRGARVACYIVAGVCD